MLIYLCDQILKEFEEILKFLVKINSVLKQGNRFLKHVEQSQPKFTAAGFYLIKKSTLFWIINATITFLIIFIQFRVHF